MPVLALVFAGLKLDHILGTSWGVVLLPLWLMLAFELAASCYLLQGAPKGERERMAHAVSRGVCVTTALLALWLLMANLRLDNIISTWLPVFIVFFIASGFYFCCCMCGACMLTLAPKQHAVDVPPAADGGFSDAASTDRSAPSSSPGGSGYVTPSEDAPLLQPSTSTTYRTSAAQSV